MTSSVPYFFLSDRHIGSRDSAVMAGGLPDSVEIVRVEVHVEAAKEEDGGGVQLLYDEVQELEGGGRTLSQLHRVPQDVRGSASHLNHILLCTTMLQTYGSADPYFSLTDPSGFGSGSWFFRQ